MRIKRSIFALLNITLLILLSNSTFAQSDFGNRCAGRWKGTMYMYTQGKLTDSVPVVLEVTQQNDSVFGWKMNYLSKKLPLVKPYQLIYKGKNRYQTDEGNDIKIDGYLFVNRLISVFETEEILLTSTYELRGDTLYFEVTAGKKGPSDSEVRSYNMGSLQNVLFQKISE